MKKNKHSKVYSAPISLKEAHLNLEKVVSPELLDICNSFKMNIDNLSSVALLPVSIAYHTAHHTNWIERFRRAMQEGNLKGTKEEQKVEIERRMDALDKDDSLDWSMSVLDDLIDDTDIGIKQGITSLLNFSIVNLWTIFETLSEDMWIAIVNARPETLAKTAVQSKKDDIMKSLTNLMIESSFEISMKNKIGNIVSHKYDFNGLKGIIKAYSDILQREKSTISSLFNNQLIKEVQALRNVIVHNSGIIDQAFCGMINDTSKLGSKIEITGEQLTNYANEILKLCTEFILLIDTSIQKDYTS